MPAALDAGDKKILLIAGAVLLLLVTLTAIFSPTTDEAEGEGLPTTYSTTRNGTQAAYLLLRDLGYRSERWEQPPGELPTNALGTILILANPMNFPEKGEQEALLRFVRGGGWVVYSGNLPFLFLGTGSVSSGDAALPGSEPQNFTALAPSLLTRDSPTISMKETSLWQASEGNQVPLYGDEDGSVVSTWKLEKGRVIWWAAPTPITNSGISREGNLAFFLGCIKAALPGTSPGETTVLWDEYFHGYRGSLLDYFGETPVLWAVYQLALVGLFLLLAFSRRSGPVFAPVPESRLSPLEFVDTLGDLYRRGNAGPAAVRVAYQRFRTQLLRRLGLAPSTSNRQLDAAARERLGWKQPGLADALQRADRAGREANLHGSDALRLVQALEHYEVLFGLKTRSIEEKR
jgi:hypothetical protein